jgi:hypothetical protein
MKSNAREINVDVWKGNKEKMQEMKDWFAEAEKNVQKRHAN